MANVVIDKFKIDLLANAIADKSGEPVTMTLDEMVEAVDGIQTGGGEPNLQAKTYTVSSAGTSTVTADSGYDGLSEVEVSVPSMSFYETVLTRNSYTTINGVRYWQPPVGIEVFEGGEGWIAEGAYTATDTFYAVASNTTVTPTESSQTIGGANYMMEGAVTVNAISSSYVGSGITRRSSSDLTASGATVTVPSGYYSAQASKAVASGTAGTPTATKGNVSNHSISVTPSVTNTTGYITGSTKTGTAVTVSASELVSGSETKTANGTYDVTNLASLVVNVSGGGSSKNVQVVQQNNTRVTATTYTKACGDITVSKTGTYDVYWTAYRTSTSGTWGTQLYIGSTAYGTAQTTFTNSYYQAIHLSNVSLTANQTISVYGRSRGSNYYLYVGQLTIIEA